MAKCNCLKKHRLKKKKIENYDSLKATKIIAITKTASK